MLSHTIGPRSSDPFYLVTYYINWVTLSWTYNICEIISETGWKKVSNLYIMRYSDLCNRAKMYIGTEKSSMTDKRIITNSFKIIFFLGLVWISSVSATVTLENDAQHRRFGHRILQSPARH